MLTVLTLFSAVVLTLMLLVLVRPSRENLISIRSESPSESRNNRGRELPNSRPGMTPAVKAVARLAKFHDLPLAAEINEGAWSPLLQYYLTGEPSFLTDNF